MTKRTRYFMTGAAAVLALGLCTGLVAYYGGGFQSLVASTGPMELAYVPADAAVVAFADVRSIMDSELRQRFKQHVPMNEEGQREFFDHTGIDIEHDIDYVVAAVTAPVTGAVKPSGMVVARGRFDIVKLEALARAHGAEVQDYKGKRLLVLRHMGGYHDGSAQATQTTDTANHTGVLAFLEPGLVAIGDFNSVHRAIDAQLTAQSITSNNEMMNLVSDMVATNNAWAVGRFDLIATQTKLPDEIARHLPPVKWFAAAGHINGGVSAQLRAEANDDQAAENLRGVLNGIISLARLQGQNDPKLTTLIQSLHLSGSGKTVELSFTVPAEIFELMAPKVQAQ